MISTMTFQQVVDVYSRYLRKDRVERSTFRRFWETLLVLAEPKTKMHAHISPSDREWISTSSHGIQYNYCIYQHEGKVEVYIDRGDAATNKRIFDELRTHE